ncbi:IclR family transcriptional regulator [Lutimaribacter sp. EGI FJ00015]|uniref:IclR family transcriptional regulator n=1 Tax=Lutimaribacter degradans TaxID=2945989 RepID=A0ACC5ZZV2_9RHOB|nr:IclR family transcriptional regulator [Lutimaribacter sp. EGI FJ00013]MCM2562889.1 IclR family transcriptional regulator [Lutimaribacter sp. EGI FJ00013]MCO0614046.1 IclR family transcriptional regulator [Lutimaribacter sp. EGI FJ00015]MCO0637018.1 IclR family transcriptional regulator [Lutimaribacter sp. EGI FJ00014]
MHLDRLIAILEIVAVAGRPVTTAEIQKATGLPKPTCYRLIQTLQDQGLVEAPSGDGRVVIGERLIRIALLGKSDVDVRRAAAPLLKSAAIQFNETVFLARFRNGQVEIIHVETPDDPGRAFVHPGLGVRPMHACSCSKAIAAFTEPEFQESIISGSLKAYTEHTKTTDTELRADFARIAERGFADCDQEIDLGIASVAAPVSIGNIGATFSVGAVGPIRRFGNAYREEIGFQLIDLADRVSGAIQLCNVAEV